MAVGIHSARSVLVMVLFVSFAIPGARAGAQSTGQPENVSIEVRTDNDLCQRAFQSKEFLKWKQSYQSGRYAEAEKLWADVLKHTKGCKSIGRLITRARDTIDLNLAEDQTVDVPKLYAHLHKATLKALGPTQPAVASTARFMAQELEVEGKYREAWSYRQLEYAIREKAFGKMHPYTINTLQDLAQHYLDQKKYSEALPYLRTALERWAAIKNELGIRETSSDYYKTLKALGKTQEAQEVKKRYRL